MTEAVLEKENPAKGTQKIRIEQNTFGGLIWFGAWLFTIGFLHLSFWKAVISLVIWPYYLGTHLSATLR